LRKVENRKLVEEAAKKRDENLKARMAQNKAEGKLEPHELENSSEGWGKGYD